MSGTLVSNLGKSGLDTLFSDGIGDDEVIGYAVWAPVASMFSASQYRFCQDASSGLLRNCWNSPRSWTVLPVAWTPLHSVPDAWWPRASSSVS